MSASSSGCSLKEVRERLLGYKFDAVVRFTGIPRDRLRALEEEHAEPTVFEAEMLARVYGIDADRLAEEPVQLAFEDGIRTLALHEEFREVDDHVRLGIVSAANAARDLVRLRRLAQVRVPSLDVLRLSRVEPGTQPHREGATHAHELRRKFRLGSEPIPSMRDFVATRFPPIAVLYARLGSHGPAGLTFVDHLRGATVVLNLEGKNENPCVRRFSLAHELYHVLQDWNRRQPLAILSGYLTDTGLERERRANAFAMRLLCPQTKLRGISEEDPPEATVAKLKSYGLHYAALRLYLRNERGVRLPPKPPPSIVGMGTEQRWSDAEEPLGIANFPLAEVPPERRTLVAHTAARLHSTGKLSRGAFAEALGVTPAVNVERVMDFFGLDLPPEGN